MARCNSCFRTIPRIDSACDICGETAFEATSTNVCSPLLRAGNGAAESLKKTRTSATEPSLLRGRDDRLELHLVGRDPIDPRVDDMTWHILDTGSVWLKEFARALSHEVPTHNWCPEIRSWGHCEDWEKIDQISDHAIEMTRFPLQRGYARFPIAQFLPFEKAVVERLQSKSPKPELSTLICTAPFYAPVAERWPGRVVYYLTDLTKEYPGMNAKQIVALDRRMCRVAGTVCPNSTRIANYLIQEAGCDAAKVRVIPNATRAQNVLDQPLTAPAPLPADIADLPRPILGVLGNLAGNMDWDLISAAVEKTADVSWVFVGPTDMKVADSAHAKIRQDLLSRGGRIRFVGPKKYGELRDYARCFDVALMPYRNLEPTFSGSATRFYEHLAACRPILSSRGFHELLTKEPLLKLVDDADGIAAAMESLRRMKFRDGVEEIRWRASREGTWNVRARDLVDAATGPAARINVARSNEHAAVHAYAEYPALRRR